MQVEFSVNDVLGLESSTCWVASRVRIVSRRPSILRLRRYSTFGGILVSEWCCSVPLNPS